METGPTLTEQNKNTKKGEISINIDSRTKIIYPRGSINAFSSKIPEIYPDGNTPDDNRREKQLKGFNKNKDRDIRPTVNILNIFRVV